MPGRPGLTRGRALLAVVAAALAPAIAGCGPPPPQAPTAQADRLSDSLSQIAQDCGEAYQVGAFAPVSPDLEPLESDALSRVHELAGV